MSSPSSPSSPSSLLLVLLLATIATSTTTHFVHSLHADEAGINDYVLRTAGHGDVGVRYSRRPSYRASRASAGLWITSQGEHHPSSFVEYKYDRDGMGAGGGDDPSMTMHSSSVVDPSCTIAGRNATTGQVIWRVEACLSPSSSSPSSSSSTTGHYVSRYATIATSSMGIYSLDDIGTFRRWDDASGALLFDVDLDPYATNDVIDGGRRMGGEGRRSPRLMDLSPLVVGTVFASSSSKSTTTTDDGEGDECLVLLDANSGMPHDIVDVGGGMSSSSSSIHLSARAMLDMANVKRPRGKAISSARVIDASALDGGRIGAWIGWSISSSSSGGEGEDMGINVTVSVTTLSSMAYVELAIATPSTSSIGTAYRVVRSSPLSISSSTSSDIGLEAFILSSTRFVVRQMTDGGGRGRAGDEGPHATIVAIAANRRRLLLATMDVASSASASKSSSSCVVRRGRVIEIDAVHPYLRRISSITVDDGNDDEYADGSTASGGIYGAYHAVRVSGVDDRYPTIFPRRIETLFLLGGVDNDDEDAFQRVYGPSRSRDEEVHHDALVHCPAMDLVIASSRDDEGRTIASALRIDRGGLERWIETPSSSTRHRGHRATWSSATTISTSGGTVVVIAPPPDDPSSPTAAVGLVRRGHLLECSAKGMIVAFTSIGGTTSAFRYEPSSTGGDDDDDTVAYRATSLWSSEEALASISSALFLDETHALPPPSNAPPALATDDVGDEEEKLLSNLLLVNRLRSQLSSLEDFVVRGGALSSLASLALPSDDGKAARDAAFGFAKVAVALSERMHRIVALDTARGGRTVWTMNLHPRATWHRLVHGGQFMSLSDPRGNGGVHDHEMLALSYVAGDDPSSSFVEWKCLDGIGGRVLSDGTVRVSSSVAQVVPLRALTHHPHEARGCRQVALLVHSDNTVSVIPDSARAYSAVDEAMSTPAEHNGLFVHTLDKKSGVFHALRVTRRAGSELSPAFNPFELITIGSVIFDPTQERIVNVAYPLRGEVIQSPSIVMGDDSLLLKYLNPHFMVIVTEATKGFLSSVAPESDNNDSSGNAFYNALAGGHYSSTSTGQKRKPLGANKPGVDMPPSPNAALATPTLFITLVDTVSGQILHRVSHAHVLESDVTEGPSVTRVPVVISENWIVYSFFNHRTRRTDIGVLTLHEGMIDKNGITAFSSPEQELSFSSLESSKPIVLSKTFGLAKAVTALGVTTTRAGISSKQFLFATSNDQVVSLDRRMLDPRRPNGDLKESEKIEGLMKYEPLLPIIPMRTPSHVYEVSSVASILSASANVESQSLVIAYGGPDIFFTRLSPSKGFDLLPDDFNRGLLTVVLVGLIVLLNVMQRMNKKKMVTTLWL